MSTTESPPVPGAEPVSTSPEVAELCRVPVLVVGTSPGDENARRTLPQVDLLLPVDVPLASVIFDAIGTIESELRKLGRDVSIFRTRAPGRWAFSRAGGNPIADEKTLQDLDLGDGERLVLSRARTKEEFPILIDDLTVGASGLLANTFTPWSTAAARAAGAGAAALAALAIAVLSGVWAIMRRSDVIVPALTLAAAAAVTYGAMRAVQRQNRDVGAALILAAYPLAAVGGASIVSGPWGPFHVAAAAAAVAAVGAVSASLRISLVLASAVVTTAAVLLVAGLVQGFYPVGHVAMGVAITLVGWTLVAPKIAVLVSRMPLPPVPTVGQTSDEPDRAPRFLIQGSKTASPHQAPDATEFEQRAKAAHDYLTGLICAASVCIVGGTQLATQPGNRRYLLAVIFTSLVSFTVLRRARNSADRWQVTVQLAAAATTVAITVVRFAIADGRIVVVALTIAALLAAGAGCLAAGLLLTKDQFSPVTKRTIEVLEWIATTAFWAMAPWIMDIYYAANNIW